MKSNQAPRTQTEPQDRSIHLCTFIRGHGICAATYSLGAYDVNFLDESKIGLTEVKSGRPYGNFFAVMSVQSFVIIIILFLIIAVILLLCGSQFVL